MKSILFTCPLKTRLATAARTLNLTSKTFARLAPGFGRVVLVTVLTLAGLAVRAQTTTYWTNGTAANAGGSWNAVLSWKPNTVPAGSNIAAFTNTLTGASTVTLDASQTVGALLVTNAGSQSWIFNAGTPSTSTLTLAPGAGNGTILVSAQTATINAVVAGTQGLLKNGGGNLTLTANNTFTGNFTNAAGGTTILSGNNAYAGGTYLAGGTVSIGTDANVGGAATPITFLGGTLQITGTTLNNLDAHTVNWAGFNGTLDINNVANTFSINSSLTGGGTLTKTGAGILVLNNPDTRTGNTTINGGKLVISGSSSLATGATLTLANNSLFDPSALGPYSVAANQTITGSGGIKADVSLAAGAKIVPGGAAATGVLSISNTLTLGGQVITIDLRTNNAVNCDLIAVGGAVTLNSNLVITLNYLTPLTNGTYTILTSSGLTLNGFSVSLDKNYRNVTLNVGAANIDVVVAAGGAAAKNLTWVGGGANPWDIGLTTGWNDGVGASTYYDLDTVTITDAGSATPAITLNTNVFPASVTFSNLTQNYTVSGTGKITGTTSLTKRGTATLTLGTSNDFSGTTTLVPQQA